MPGAQLGLEQVLLTTLVVPSLYSLWFRVRSDEVIDTAASQPQQSLDSDPEPVRRRRGDHLCRRFRLDTNPHLQLCAHCRVFCEVKMIRIPDNQMTKYNCAIVQLAYHLLIGLSGHPVIRLSHV